MLCFFSKLILRVIFAKVILFFFSLIKTVYYVLNWYWGIKIRPEATFILFIPNTSVLKKPSSCSFPTQCINADSGFFLENISSDKKFFFLVILTIYLLYNRGLDRLLSGQWCRKQKFSYKCVFVPCSTIVHFLKLEKF